MPDPSIQRNYRSPRVFSRRARYYGLTLPQLGAVATGVALALPLWWLLGLLPVFARADLTLFAVHLLLPGTGAGALAVLLYALADDLREPVLRQLLFYTLGRLAGRHRYHRDHNHKETPTHAPIAPTPALPRARARAGLVTPRRGRP